MSDHADLIAEANWWREIVGAPETGLVHRLTVALEATVQERDELRASLTELQPTSAVWRANRAAEDAKREADALAAVVERVREARGNHPECDQHDEDDPVSCGWKRAVQGIDAALRDAPAVSLAEHDAQVLEAAAERIRHKQHAESIRQMLRGEAARIREGAGR